MGAMFFLLLLVIILIIAIIFILLSSILLFVRKVKKCKGKTVSKAGFVAPLILLFIGVAMASMPIMYLVSLRSNNAQQTADEIVKVESADVLYWPEKSTSNWFEFEGTKYVMFFREIDSHVFILDYDETFLGEPVSNIQNNPDYASPVSDSLRIVLGGKKFADDNIATIYPIKNPQNFNLCFVGTTVKINSYTATYCTEEEADAIRTYYEDLKNYDTTNLSYSYTYSVNESVNKAGYESKTKTITLPADTYAKIDALAKDSINRKSLPMPDSYQSITLTTYSNDKMAFQDVALCLIDKQVYNMSGVGKGKVSGYPFPEDLSTYFIENVFNVIEK